MQQAWTRREFLSRCALAGAGVCAFAALGRSAWGQTATMNLREALYYRRLADGRTQCTLCPNLCTRGKGEDGLCHARGNRNGTYYSLVYSRPCVVAMDEVEKCPLNHYQVPGKAFSIATAIPDTIGGVRRIDAWVGSSVIAKTTFYINPSIISLEPTSGPVGTVAHFQIKGLSWTVTAKDYYINYDNSLIGYACAMTSHGTINVYLPMTGAVGWHFIDFWNGIYKGSETAKIDQLRTPLLNLADHPGETVVAMHFAFQITG